MTSAPARAATLAAALLLHTAAPLDAQTVGGIVRDARTGAVVEHATVALRNAADSTVATARSDSLGMFYLAAPGPGHYSLRLAFGAGPEHAGATVVLASADDFHQAEYAIEVHANAPFIDTQVDTAAAPRGVAPPRYPVRLLDARVAGHAVVQYVVGADGRVERGNVRLVEATDPAFAAAIPDALRRARYRPASIGGRPVRQLVQERYEFGFVNRTPTIRIRTEPAIRLPDLPSPPR